ncbi:MAG: hypothetical protein RL385_4794 [Pseudomonadota bacterium]|jgi:hypothetical protein
MTPQPSHWRFLLVSSLAGSLARADAAPLRDLLADDLVSELGVARVADDAGDQALQGALGGSSGRHTTLVAVRAAAYAHAPEQLWPLLVTLACGRDPVLAPEAALSLRRGVLRTGASDLARREVLLSDLRAVRSKLGCAEGTPRLRQDIALALHELSAHVDRLLTER